MRAASCSVVIAVSRSRTIASGSALGSRALASLSSLANERSSIMSSQSSTHSLQIDTDGPAISIATSCCGLPQNEQYRVGAPVTAAAGVAGRSASIRAARMFQLPSLKALAISSRAWLCVMVRSLAARA